MGGTPLFWALFGDFGGFTVKTVCNPGLPGNPSQQRKRYTTHRGSSQRPSRGSILHSLRVYGPNRPSGGPLKWPPMGGVPFSLLAWIPWEARIAHVFTGNPPKSTKSAQNRGYPPFFHVFFILYLFNFFPGACPGPKKVLL